MNGYLADVSEGDEDSANDLGMDIQSGSIIDVRARDALRPLYRRRRSLKRRAPDLSAMSAQEKPAPSPIHPAIDISFTHHISSSDFADKGFSNLSVLPVDYFTTLSQWELANAKARSNATKLMDASSEISSRGAESNPPGIKHATSRDQGKGSETRSYVKHASRIPQTESKTQQQHFSGGAQVISAISTVERAAATIFSKQYRFLEDCITLTQTPR
jgi:hypothetical protein